MVDSTLGYLMESHHHYGAPNSNLQAYLILTLIYLEGPTTILFHSRLIIWKHSHDIKQKSVDIALSIHNLRLYIWYFLDSRFVSLCSVLSGFRICVYVFGTFRIHVFCLRVRYFSDSRFRSFCSVLSGFKI